MGTDVFLLTKPAGSNSIQRACTQANSTDAVIDVPCFESCDSDVAFAETEFVEDMDNLTDDNIMGKSVSNKPLGLISHLGGLFF